MASAGVSDLYLERCKRGIEICLTLCPPANIPLHVKVDDIHSRSQVHLSLIAPRCIGNGMHGAEK